MKEDRQRSRELGVDAVVGHRLIEVKLGVAALRSVKEGLMQLAYALAENPDHEGYLVLADASVTLQSLQKEWRRAASVLRPQLLNRLTLCVGDADQFTGIPRNPDAETRRILSEVVEAERPRVGSPVARSDASFVITKILLNQWLKDAKPVTTDWLSKTSGYSYPTISAVLHRLGSLIQRESDRRVRFRWFPREELARLLAHSNRARSTVRFADRSGKSRSPESHVRRLQVLNPTNVAIGGVLGARHYFPDLDLLGLPRLDLSQHAPKRHLDLGFVKKLDPALRIVEDPQEPADLVIHAVQHKDPLFEPRRGGLYWADPVECLLDMHEAGLEVQASQFLKELERTRSATHSER